MSTFKKIIADIGKALAFLDHLDQPSKIQCPKCGSKNLEVAAIAPPIVALMIICSADGFSTPIVEPMLWRCLDCKNLFARVI